MDGQVGTLTTLRERLAEGRFHLAVLGQFKRGKSTLLNALLERKFFRARLYPSPPYQPSYVAENNGRLRFTTRTGAPRILL